MLYYSIILSTHHMLLNTRIYIYVFCKPLSKSEGRRLRDRSLCTDVVQPCRSSLPSSSRRLVNHRSGGHIAREQIEPSQEEDHHRGFQDKVDAFWPLLPLGQQQCKASDVCCDWAEALLRWNVAISRCSHVLVLLCFLAASRSWA